MYHLHMNREHSTIAAVIAFVLALVLAPQPAALARQEIDWDERQNESYAKNIESPPSLERAELLALLSVTGIGEDQKPVLDDLFQSYEEKLRASRKKMGTWYKQTFIPNGQWTNDREVWDKAQPIQEKYRKHCQKLRDNLMEDAKLLLTNEQADAWPKVQARLKRRDTMRSGAGQVGLATIDVEQLVRDVLDGAPMPEDTAGALNGYQDALDRAAAVAGAYKPEESKFANPASDDGDFGRKWQGTYYARSVEQWKPVRDVNVAAFRRALPTLPENLRDRARLAFYSKGTREGGWSWYDGSALDFSKVAAIKTLTQKQKDEIAQVRADYEKAAADKAEQSANEVLKAQDDDPVEFGSKQNEPGEWTKRWQERIDAEKKPRERLQDILTDAQFEQAGLGKKGKALQIPKFEQ
jgi:hypothetical protein